MTRMRFLSAVVVTVVATAAIPFTVDAQREARAGLEEEVLRAEREGIDATMKGDTDALKRSIADEYVEIGLDGHMIDKTKMLEAYKPGVADSIKSEQMKVRTYGDVAVVNGVYRIRWKGASTIESFRFTHVWAKDGGRWRLNTTHATLIEPAAAKDSEKK